ncbi:synaptonemal complex central element protein 2 isoform X4 [Callithrix jacchus]
MLRSQVSCPCVANSSASRQLTVLEGKSGLYFSSLDSSIDILQKRAQELIENINESRQKDHALMTNFRNSLKTKVSDLTEKLEERIYQIYNDHNKIIQEKLQEFTQKMAKISHLETELKQVCHSVETVYKDLCLQPEQSLRLRRPDHSRGKSPPCPSDSQPPDVFVSSVAETTSQVVTSKLTPWGQTRSSLFSSPSLCSNIQHKALPLGRRLGGHTVNLV